jgi:hypothetical protein
MAPRHGRMPFVGRRHALPRKKVYQAAEKVKDKVGR